LEIIMLKAWRGFRGLSAGDQHLVSEGAMLLLLVSPGLWILSYPTVQRLLERYSNARRTPSAAASVGAVQRITWAVSAVARWLPMRTTCLVEALVADIMLRRRGCACVLRIGVKQPGSDARAFKAHAWIEHDGVVVFGAIENLRDYTVLSSPRSS
jgi:transglutaminase superfamily protein